MSLLYFGDEFRPWAVRLWDRLWSTNKECSDDTCGWHTIPSRRYTMQVPTYLMQWPEESQAKGKLNELRS